MPSFPLIDTHLHLWDPGRLTYSWQKGNSLLDRPYRIEDYQRASLGIDTAAMIFVECYADFGPESGQYIEEIKFVQEEAKRDPRIRALVPMAPLEQGKRAEPILEEMVTRFPSVRGIRRILQFEPDPRDFALNPTFLEGVRLLENFRLHFEITVDFNQMDLLLDFVQQVPNLPMILDHCGKPGIRSGHIEPFRRHMRELARHPNVVCKLSDLPVEADVRHWTEADLRPYIETVLHAFGVDRVIYGGDWPVCLQATTLERWVAVLDHAFELAGLSRAELRRIYRDNANRFYRLELPEHEALIE